MNIQFNVENQHMERIDNNLLVADSIDYLVAQFTFTEDWDGLIKTATFKKNGKAYYAILENDECIVPHEAIKPGTTYVSVHAGNLITSEVLELKFKVSGYQEPAEPTPSVYQQIMDKLNNLVGGHKDQVLTKNSEDDFDFKWRTGGGGGGGGSVYWGDLGGYISDQEDLQEELDKKLSIKDMPTYDNLSYEKDYLYKTIYETLDYRYANEYMKSKKPIPLGACSSVRNGNFYGRNFDWTYDYNSEFIVNTPRTLDRYAVLGVASTVKLTDDFVKSGEASELYKIMPFMLMDGINEKGLVANVNVVPQDKGVTFGTTPRVELKNEFCSSILVRFVLDHFATAAEAVTYLRDYCSIFTSSSLVEMGYEPHFMIADENETYIVEFINNVISILNVTDKPIMTNFHLTGVTFNSLGEVTINRDNSGHNSSGVSLNGSGLERFNLIVQNYDSADDKQGMRDLMTQLNYTNTYNPSYPNFWYTEFTGIEGLNVTSPTYQFTSIVQREAAKFANRSRDPLDTEHYGTWQTTHSSIYDIPNRRLYLISQEDNIEKVYNLMVSDYSKDDIDTIIEDTKQWVEDKGYATEDSVPSDLSDLQSDSEHRTVSDSEKESWNAKSDFSGDYYDLTNRPIIPSIEGLASEQWVEDQGYAKETDVPQKISDLENDSDFVTRSVNTLIYYYLKSDVYTKSEVNNLISAIAQIHFQIVNVLPTRDIDLHTIYFVPKEGSTTNTYNEYVYINNKWELIGSTDVDLSNYFTKAEVNALLALKVGEVDVDPKLNSGIKIAEITVDGVTKSLYAPQGGSGAVNWGSIGGDIEDQEDLMEILDTIPDKTSLLINDSDFVSDANYVHTDNNYTDAEKTKVANALTEHQQLKTINDQSIIGTGNIEISGTDVIDDTEPSSETTYSSTKLENKFKNVIETTNITKSIDEKLTISKLGASGILEGIEQGYRDIVVIPDKYNTGLTTPIEELIPWAEWKTSEYNTTGLEFRDAGLDFNNGICFKNIYNTITEDTVFTFENIDFTGYGNGAIFFTNGWGYKTSSTYYIPHKITFRYVNCLFTGMNMNYEINESARDNIRFEVINCKCHRISMHEIHVDKCQIGNCKWWRANYEELWETYIDSSAFGDTVNGANNSLIENSYIFDAVDEWTNAHNSSTGEPRTQGEAHIDTFQCQENTGVHFNNVRFECPDVKYEISQGAVNVLVYFERDTTDGIVENCVLNGGSWYIFQLSPSAADGGVELNNLLVGYAGRSLFHTNTPEEYDITRTSKIYVSSVFKENGHTYLVATNDTLSERTMNVVTDKGNYTFTLSETQQAQSGTYPYDDFDEYPIDVLCDIPQDVSYIIAYDDNEQIRFVNFDSTFSVSLQGLPELVESSGTYVLKATVINGQIVYFWGTEGESDFQHVDITMAEFEALTPEQQTDPNIEYFITDGQGGGGTTVIANPTETGTEIVLERIQIGDVHYKINYEGITETLKEYIDNEILGGMA